MLLLQSQSFLEDAIKDISAVRESTYPFRHPPNTPTLTLLTSCFQLLINLLAGWLTNWLTDWPFKVVDEVAEMLGGRGSGIQSILDKLVRGKPNVSDEQTNVDSLFQVALQSLVTNKQSSVIQILTDFKGLLAPKNYSGGT